MEQTARYYGTGHRKNATARVWLTPGDGNVVINGVPMAMYVGRKSLELLIMQPFEPVDCVGKYDVMAKCKGGGISGQQCVLIRISQQGQSRQAQQIGGSFVPPVEHQDADMHHFILADGIAAPFGCNQCADDVGRLARYGGHRAPSSTLSACRSTLTSAVTAC